MKKILALVLALVMTLSLATISSGAAFSDADSVQYTDAVNTLTALGVLNGYADGSIKPQGDVTRGAAAKMVAMVATGSNTTTLGYYKGTSSFADVPATHVFADAVAFCVARGIVAGYGDGNYGLTDNVKGWAVAKMVLVAMGYDAKAYGMEGTGSALNTITLASSLGLFAGMKSDFVATEAATREECAQIVYNALTLQGKVANPTSSDGVVSFSDSKSCLLSNYVKGAVYDDATKPAISQLNSGMVTANQDTGATTTTIGGKEYAVETGKELIGHVVLAVENGAKDAYGNPCVYAVVDLSSEVVVAKAIAKKADFEAAFGTTAPAIDAAKSDEKVTDLAVFHNYAPADLAKEFVFASGDTKATSAGTYVIYNGEVVSYLTAASDLVVLTVDVSNATKGYYTVSDKSGEKAVTYVNVEETAANCYDKITSAAAIDWLAMVETGKSSATALYVGTPCGSKLAVEEVKFVEGKASLINASTDKITVNGTVYDYVPGETAAVAAMAAGTAAISDAFVDFANTYKFYLDEAGKIFATLKVTDEVTDTNSYELAYLVGGKRVETGIDATYGTKSYAYSIQYYTVDGAVNTAAYYSYNGAKLAEATDATKGEVKYDAVANSGWVLLAKTDAGAVVKAITDDGATGYYVATAKAGKLAAGQTKFDGNFVNKASTFLYGTAAKMDAANVAATVKTGAHDVTFEKNFSVVLKDSANKGQKDIVAAWVGADFAGAAVAADFVFVVSYEGYVGADAVTKDALHSYTVVDKNGDIATATYAVVETEEAKADSYVGGWFKLSTNSATGLTTFNGSYTDTIAAVEGATAYEVDGVNYMDKSGEYVVASGLKLHDLRAEVADGSAEAVTSVAGMLALESGKYDADAIYTVDTYGVKTIIAIIVLTPAS